MSGNRGNEKLPEGWKRVRLGDAISFKNGKSPQIVDGGIYPIYGSNGLIGYTDNYFLDGVFLLVGRVGASGEIHMVSGKLWASDNCLIGKCGSNTFPIFIYYLLKHLDLKKHITQTAQPLITQSFIENITTSLPPLPEQHKIASILETVDNAIEKTDRIIQKYKRIKQGLMQDLLTKGIDENGQIRSEEMHRFKDSELGRIPEEWEVVEFYDLFDVIDNRGRTPPFFEEGTIPYLSAENIKDGKILYNFGNFVTDEVYKKYMRGIPTRDYILFTTEAPLGEVALTPKIKFCFAQRVIAMKPKKGISRYYFFLTQHELIQRQLNNLVSGTTVKGISAKNLKNVYFISPPLPEQHNIASILSQIDETIEKEQKYKEKLERIKQGLMEDLLTGRVRVNHLIEEKI